MFRETIKNGIIISKLLFFISVLFSPALSAQEVQIPGETVLCPNSNGTAYVVNDMPIDSYQWLVRGAFTSNPFDISINPNIEAFALSRRRIQCFGYDVLQFECPMV